jgi:hypothetical protein
MLNEGSQQAADGPLVTFMIATRNRVDELMQTLESCLNQTWPHKEVLVVDDASTDGTYEAVRSRFPGVDIVRLERNCGSVAARNDVLRRARGDYVIALDDDSRFTEPDACQRIVARFEAEPDLGILAFQVVGPEFPERMTEAGAWSGEWHCSSFGAGAAALRREILTRTGLFAEYFFHAYEEPDLTLRAWDAGYRAVQWNAIRVFHANSPLNRSLQRTHRRHTRNEACSIWMRYPWHLVIPATAVRLARQFRHAVRNGWAWKEPRVWAETLLRLPVAIFVVGPRSLGRGDNSRN